MLSLEQMSPSWTSTLVENVWNFRGHSSPHSRSRQGHHSASTALRQLLCCSREQLQRQSCRHAANRQEGRRPTQLCSSLQPGALSPSQRTRADYVATPPAGGRDFFKWLLDLPWQRVAVWMVIVFTALQLKEFFGIAMGTFIIAFIGDSFVRSAERTVIVSRISPKWRRKLLVLLYFSSILALVILFGVMTIPDIIREGADFVTRLQSDNIWVVVLEKMRAGLGDGLMDNIERLIIVSSGDELSGHMAALGSQAWTQERTAYLGEVLSKMLRGYTNAAVQITSGLISAISHFAVQVGVSMVLSFMIMVDLPNISAGVASLKSSRLDPFYQEVAPSVTVFANLFGKALQAQAKIALMNTALTALGMLVLMIPGTGLLSLFVFLCSFIPVAGCFISTFPIGFVALTEYGFLKLALVVAMVIGVHMVEAYGLNPIIYSAHLKLHPLLVLTVLFLAEHSLGVWGLLLAVPLTVFTVDYCIRYPSCSIKDVAAMELETVSITDSRHSSYDEDTGRGPVYTKTNPKPLAP